MCFVMQVVWYVSSESTSIIFFNYFIFLKIYQILSGKIPNVVSSIYKKEATSTTKKILIISTSSWKLF